ncbi:MAG: hypothetical protein ABJM58_11655 [Alteripontixanthobacter sp.]
MPLVLYSTITSLAYVIARRYYGDVHYAWCAPGDPPDQYDMVNPPSSHPVQIYRDFLRDIESSDGHSGKIEQNRIGLTRGAEARYKQKKITSGQRDRVIEIIKRSEFGAFRPLMLVIPFEQVCNDAQLVDVGDQANAMSEEYICPDLPRVSFDILQLSGIRS